MAFTLSMDEVIVTYFTPSPASATLPLRIFGMANTNPNAVARKLLTPEQLGNPASYPCACPTNSLPRMASRQGRG